VNARKDDARSGRTAPHAVPHQRAVERRRRQQENETVAHQRLQASDTPLRHILRHVAGALLGMVVLVGAFVAGHYVATWALTFLDLTPSAFFRVVASGTVGMLILGVLFSIFGYLEARRHSDPFNAIVASIQRIAKGDFGARAEVPVSDDEHALGRLVTSINEMAGELETMEQLRQEFVSNVSHEIRSPLTSIQGFAEALRDDALPPEDRRRYLAIIETESRRLGELSDNLLRLTSLEAEREPLSPEPFALDRQVRQVILAAEPLWAAKGIALEARLDPTTIRGDEALLAHVWANLLENAVKFTPEGGRISVTLAASEGAAQVRVSDSGPGIPDEARDRIFERFFKADPSRDRRTPGSGLGLALARKIVELHGGSIRAEAGSESGAVFSVTLPSGAPPGPSGEEA